MAKQKTASVADLIGMLNRLSPVDLAEDWDNVGLQVGDPQQRIDKILVCLDADEPALEEARRCGAQLIISHHPLIFKAIKRLTPADATGRILFTAVKHDIAIACAHTNLDRAADGLNDWLAERLQLQDCTPVEAPLRQRFHKFVIFVPVGHENAVMEAMFAAGAGHVGGYDRCSFRTLGTGSFRGGDEAQPFIGTAGAFEEAEEVRLETILPSSLIGRVVNKALKAHPYEEVAYDLIPLSNTDERVGLGRIGRLHEQTSAGVLAEQIKQQLGLPSLRMVGRDDMPIRKVAVCGGSGMSIYTDAVRQGADCLVTGDVKFHEAQRARTDGVVLIDAGHFGTEVLMVPELAQRLRLLLAEQRFAVDIVELQTEEDPFVTV